MILKSSETNCVPWSISYVDLCNFDARNHNPFRVQKATPSPCFGPWCTIRCRRKGREWCWWPQGTWKVLGSEYHGGKKNAILVRFITLVRLRYTEIVVFFPIVIQVKYITCAKVAWYSFYLLKISLRITTRTTEYGGFQCQAWNWMNGRSPTINSPCKILGFQWLPSCPLPPSSSSSQPSREMHPKCSCAAALTCATSRHLTCCHVD